MNWARQDMMDKCINLLFVALAICITVFMCITSYLTTEQINEEHEEPSSTIMEGYNE